MRSSLSFLVILPALALGWAGNSATSELSASDFASTNPFYACTYRSPSYASAVDGRLTVFFDEADYDGTRVDRGVEICADMDPVLKELWHGFNIYVPSDYPDDKQSIISQHFCLGYCASWCGTLAIVQNQLQIEYRSSCSSTADVTEVIVDDITRDTWHPIVLNARFSNSNDGRYVVYYDGDEIYNVQDINLGFDNEWTDNGSMTTGVGFKNGQYNADTSVYTGDTRTLYFDNVSWYNIDDGQTDGYDVVVPP